MKHIDYFNWIIKRMIKESPSDSTLLAIEKYRIKANCKDYYQALDNVGFKVGFHYLVDTIYDANSGEPFAFEPCIRFDRNNSLNVKDEVIEFGSRKSMNKAYEFVAKEYVYRLILLYEVKFYIFYQYLFV